MLSVSMRPSRTLAVKNAPQRFYWLTLEGQEAIASREVLLILGGFGLTQPKLRDLWSWTKSILLRVEACRAIDPDDVRPIWRDDRIWEVRIHYKAQKTLLRLYFAEIPQFPKHLLALHAHIKTIGEDDQETADAQNAAIAVAVKRLDQARIEGYPGRELDLTRR